MAAIGDFTASVSKKMRQASEGIKTMNDKNRLKKEISRLQSELSGKYENIGIRFFNETSAAPDPSYQELFDQVSTLQEEIRRNRQKLSRLDGAVPCPNCGQSVLISAHFCSNCGQKIEAEQQSEEHETPVAVCKFCGDPLEDSAVFCASCGNKVGEAVIVPEPSEVPVPEAAPVAEAEELPADEDAPVIEPAAEAEEERVIDIMPSSDDVQEVIESENLCPNCGQALSSFALFCDSCGFAIPEKK